MIPTTTTSPPHSPSSSTFQVTEDPLTSLPLTVEPVIKDTTPTPSLHVTEQDENLKVDNTLVEEDEDDNNRQRKIDNAYVPLHGFFIHMIECRWFPVDLNLYPSLRTILDRLDRIQHTGQLLLGR